MELANSGEFVAAVETARPLWLETHDQRIGLALIQLLEQSSLRAAQQDLHDLWLLHQTEAAQLARSMLASVPQRPARPVAGDSAAPLLDQSGADPALQQQLARVLWHEAALLARMGDPEGAFKVLVESLDAGWDDYSEILADPDFRSLGQTPRLKGLVSNARARHRLRQTEIARTELNDFRTFPFALQTDDVAGEPLSLQDLQGRIVVIHFWGTWCPLCCEQIPALNQLTEEFAGSVEVLGLAFESADPELATKGVSRAMMEQGIRYRCALGEPACQDQVPGFEGFPTLLFLDRRGQVRSVCTGWQPREKAAAIVSLLLQEPVGR